MPKMPSVTDVIDPDCEESSFPAMGIAMSGDSSSTCEESCDESLLPSFEHSPDLANTDSLLCSGCEQKGANKGKEAGRGTKTSKKLESCSASLV